MLVLTRRINQSIMIGDDVEIVIVDTKGDQVKIGIKAPRNVTIQRTEILQEIQEENRNAVNTIVTPQTLDQLGSLFKKKAESPKEEK